jgi:hypothetical protein
LCFYVEEDFAAAEASSATDTSGFVVREYVPNEHLTPLPRPHGPSWHPFHRVTWQRVPDYPQVGRYGDLFSPEVADALSDDDGFEYQHRSGIKIGGWPTSIQFGYWYPGWCDIQIDITQNFIYLDGGIADLSRDRENWYAIFDCA